MAHFNPATWEIDLRQYPEAALSTSPVAQATFLHEYIHYLQTLTSTAGRCLLIEQVRTIIFAGLYRTHPNGIPSNFSQIDLYAALDGATRQDFAGTEPSNQYRQTAEELSLALCAQQVPYSGKRDPKHPFVEMTLTHSGVSQSGFTHVIVAAGTQLVAIPLNDRVFFENMARQVQRRFLLFNNELDASAVESERSTSHGDRTYVCIHDLLKETLPPTEDAARWTIVLCQMCLLCRHPGTAFEQVFKRLVGLSEKNDLNDFLRRLNRDEWFRGEFNTPALQDTIDELHRKWGSAMRIVESGELHEVLRLIASVYNIAMGNYEYFASPLLTWEMVGYWVRSFGCPPVRCSDGTLTSLFGTPTTMPWRRYFVKASELL